MYFDVRKYLDNITIQEIIPPFITPFSLKNGTVKKKI
jgi:hypothetical protein